MNNKTLETSKAGSWTVYILECSDQPLYTGMAVLLEIASTVKMAFPIKVIVN